MSSRKFDPPRTSSSYQRGVWASSYSVPAPPVRPPYTGRFSVAPATSQASPGFSASGMSASGYRPQLTSHPSAYAQAAYTQAAYDHSAVEEDSMNQVQGCSWMLNYVDPEILQREAAAREAAAAKEAAATKEAPSGATTTSSNSSQDVVVLDDEVLNEPGTLKRRKSLLSRIGSAITGGASARRRRRLSGPAIPDGSLVDAQPSELEDFIAGTGLTFTANDVLHLLCPPVRICQVYNHGSLISYQDLGSLSHLDLLKFAVCVTDSLRRAVTDLTLKGGSRRPGVNAQFLQVLAPSIPGNLQFLHFKPMDEDTTPFNPLYGSWGMLRREVPSVKPASHLKANLLAAYEELNRLKWLDEPGRQAVSVPTVCLTKPPTYQQRF